MKMSTHQHLVDCTEHDQMNMQHHVVFKENAAQKHHQNCQDLMANDKVDSCQNCHQFHCQSLSYFIEYAVPHLVERPAVISRTSMDTDHYIQHLTGYWQRILRPPKA